MDWDEAWVREIAEMPDGEFAVHTMRDVLAALDEARRLLSAAEAREAALRPVADAAVRFSRWGHPAPMHVVDEFREVISDYLAATETDAAAASARGGAQG